MPPSVLTLKPSQLDASSSRLLEYILKQNGFKWHENGGTDLCKQDMEVSIKEDVITVKYKTRMSKSMFGSKGSVFSKSVGKVSKFVVPADLSQYISFVHVKENVKHYDWNGKLVDI